MEHKFTSKAKEVEMARLGKLKETMKNKVSSQTSRLNVLLEIWVSKKKEKERNQRSQLLNYRLIVIFRKKKILTIFESMMES